MKKIYFTLIFILALQLHLQSQTLCATANEGSNVVLTAPAGEVFIEITFASYGTPDGSCGSFTTSSCHAANSKSIVEGYLLGKNSVTIPATNTVFGDPCVGTVKRLYVQAVYGSPLPLNLISFTATVNQNGNLLNWKTSGEKNTKLFVVERSADGNQFANIGNVTAHNSEGVNEYSYTDNDQIEGRIFYRLKQTDIDGNFVYSKIISVINNQPAGLSIFPTPARNFIEVRGLKENAIVELVNLQGKVLQHFRTTSPSRKIDISSFPKGMYVLKYVAGDEVIYTKFIKQ